MRRVMVTRPGGLERLRIEVSPDPLGPAPGRVLVEVRASGLNFADVAVRMGLYDAVSDYPVCPGFEFAGRIRALGEGVTGFSVGEEVFGAIRFGANADLVEADPGLLWRRPETLGAAEAAALPTTFATAVHALENLAGVRPAERVLLHSAAGGVGLSAITVARLAGARVTGVVGRSRKKAAALDRGCARVVAAEEGDVWKQLADEEPFDVVLDANGPATLRRSYEALAPTGRLVVYGFATMLDRGGERRSWPRLVWRWLRTPRFDPFDLVMSNRSVHGFNLVHLFGDEPLKAAMRARLARVFADPEFAPLPVTTFPADRVGEAHRLLQSGDSVGKTAILW